MAQTRQFDELKTIDYETFFGEMDISEQEKRRRIVLAEELEVLFLYLFVLMKEDPLKDYLQMIQQKYQEIATRFLDMDETPAYILNQSQTVAEETARVTRQHISQEFYTSKDRAMLISANQANVIGNYAFQVEAIKMGKTTKVWRTMKDFKVRHTHMIADGQKVGIFEPFKVGNSLLNFPTDLSLGASMEEVANCRCVCKYQ